MIYYRVFSLSSRYKYNDLEINNPKIIEYEYNALFERETRDFPTRKKKQNKKKYNYNQIDFITKKLLRFCIIFIIRNDISLPLEIRFAMDMFSMCEKLRQVKMFFLLNKIFERRQRRKIIILRLTWFLFVGLRINILVWFFIILSDISLTFEIF